MNGRNGVEGHQTLDCLDGILWYLQKPKSPWKAEHCLNVRPRTILAHDSLA